ncbi:MAG: class I SAM-dependent methyltransferase [Aromatoleum sp.]|jgi:SAM-dependent methyltransferase|uniref:class I SAM-dependent methyltransferase n=1 Tax=Aromatoleum sp. TaxID=2307007 RepID=UPI00289445D8|nr:class I SAM-dependent methyltransferase [Aromatoleum sp.]MDT3671187.1 class I SAM-dependent methyltransferase [Aromatoleum sp.]
MTARFGGGSLAPSAWIVRFAPLLRAGGEVLDFACGGGRHARWLAERGFRVEAVDRDTGALASLATVPGVQVREADLENGPWPYDGRHFDGIVVTNYLFRPRFAALLDCIVPGGVLIYETFMLGNERHGKPSNPDFLLRPGELLERLHDGYLIVAFEQGEVALPRPAVVQRVCAIRHPAATPRLPTGREDQG